MIFKGIANEVLLLENIISKDNHVLHQKLENGLCILWNLHDQSILTIDGVEYVLGQNQLIFLTEFHMTKIKAIGHIRLLRFNRPFYCITDHDTDVGCKGILFFGASNVPMISIPKRETETFETLWSMFSIEMNSQDSYQMEMLRVMLKRLLILCTRIYKEQNALEKVNTSRLDIIREFHFLVEKYFKKRHDVNFYADKLHRSPKTLSNVFSGMHSKSPLQIIHERILLEARRQLIYTDKPVKEIAYGLGYDDLQAFSRFFKSKEHVPPVRFRSAHFNDQEKLPIQGEIMPTPRNGD